MSDTDKLLREHCSMHQGTLVAEKILTLLDLNAELLTVSEQIVKWCQSPREELDNIRELAEQAIEKAKALK